MSDYHSQRFRNWKNKDKTSDSLRKDRSNTSVELRKKQRDEVLNKRRNIPNVFGSAEAQSVEEENFDDLNNNNNDFSAQEIGAGDNNKDSNQMSAEQADEVARLSKAYAEFKKNRKKMKSVLICKSFF